MIPVDPATIRSFCARVTASRTFSDASRLCQFLRYIVDLTLDGREASIKEYAIGVDVFERPPDFDPKTDSIVRVHAGRLRLKLLEYYDQEGREDAVRIEIPKRSYVPVFHVTQETMELPPMVPPANSIAVLPFAALSPEEETAEFSVGLTEEIIHELAGIEGLRVVSRTSVFAMRDKVGDVRQIGGRLHVSSVLEGSVRGQNDRLRVTAQLVETADGYHKWSSTFDVSFDDRAAAQQRIAREIRRKIESKSHRHPSIWSRRRVIAAGTAAILIFAMFLFYWFSRPPAPLRASNLTRLGWGGSTIRMQSVSADGRLLVYSSNEQDSRRYHLSVRDMESGSIVRLPFSNGYAARASLSPDSKSLAYTFFDDTVAPGKRIPKASLMVMPSLGGPARKLADDALLLRYSPDGRWIVFTRINPLRLYILPSNGGEPRQLAPDIEEVNHPVWIDHERILFMGLQKGSEPRIERWDWWVSSIHGGPVIRTGVYAKLRERVIDPKQTIYIPPDAWYRDSAIFSARVGQAASLWSVPISRRTFKVTGPPTQLTFSTNIEGMASTTATGKITYLSEHRSYNLYSFPIKPQAAYEPRPITRNTVANWMQNISRDGRKMVYQSLRSGDFEMWTRILESDQEALLYKTPNSLAQPKISPDGSQIAFYESSVTADTGALKVIPFAGGAPREICTPCGRPVAWTPDGKRLIVQGGDPTRPLTIYAGTVELASGSFSKIKSPRERITPLDLSPDGALLAFLIYENDRPYRAVAPFRNGGIGPESEWFRLSAGATTARWSLDGSLLFALAFYERYDCLWAWPFDTRTHTPSGEPFPVVHFHDLQFQPAPASGFDNFFAVARDSLIVTVYQNATELWTAQLE